jgi:hypothetical protein
MNDIETAGRASAAQGGRNIGASAAAGMGWSPGQQSGIDQFAEQVRIQAQTRRHTALDVAMRNGQWQQDVDALIRAAAKIEAYLRDGTTGDEK